ncbi:MAG TPA: GNAT family N-acetyltransferase [Gemmatimonadaceae bacterium]|nr:GNAT family N-acetyltransferase [Gemmatimonadaceae bacterium]
MIHVRLLGRNESSVLTRVAPSVFDHDPDVRWTVEFFADERHHLAVALDDDLVVGMASAVHYVHPDKPPQLWINEVSVAETHRERGLGKQLLNCLIELAEELSCTEAWVLTDRGNLAARRLYESAGAEVPPQESLMYTFWVKRAGR